MKHLLNYLFSLLLMASIFIGCSEQQGPTANNDEALTLLNKVTVVEYSYPYDMDWDPPYEDCATGEDMKTHGLVEVFIREKTTPSGNLIINGWVDYNYYGGVTLENLGNGDVWTLHTGKNPFHEVIKENGFYNLHYHWNELYKLNGQTLHIHLKGHFKVLPDGTVTHDRESYTCR